MGSAEAGPVFCGRPSSRPVMCCRFAPDLFGPPDGLERLASSKLVPQATVRRAQANTHRFAASRGSEPIGKDCDL